MQYMLNSNDLLHHKVLLIFEYSQGLAALRRMAAPTLSMKLKD
jgi:hypothetical protein